MGRLRGERARGAAGRRREAGTRAAAGRDEAPAEAPATAIVPRDPHPAPAVVAPRGEALIPPRRGDLRDVCAPHSLEERPAPVRLGAVPRRPLYGPLHAVHVRARPLRLPPLAAEDRRAA